MRRTRRVVIVSCSLSLWALVAGPAAADRPTCDDLQSARDAGRTVAEVARDFGTTRARVTACARLAEQRARHDEQRAETAGFRSQRVLP